MVKEMVVPAPQVEDKEWVGFPGGELEGLRPRALCPSCRTHAEAESLRSRPRHSEATAATGGGAPREAKNDRAQPLCFQCYRLALDRDRALRAAGHLDTASEERFQTSLPFETVDVPRLERLRGERTMARAELQRSSIGRFEDKRRHAQIAARHALQRISAGLAARDASGQLVISPGDRRLRLEAAAHAAELQLPESWLPFVLAR